MEGSILLKGHQYEGKEEADCITDPYFYFSPERIRPQWYLNTERKMQEEMSLRIDAFTYSQLSATTLNEVTV